MKLMIGFLSIILLTAQLAGAAEYEGTNVDEINLKGTIYSHETKEYYDVELKFDGDIVVAQFTDGVKQIFILDDKTIKFVQNIPVSDYFSKKYYVLSLTFEDSNKSVDDIPSKDF